MGDGKPFLVVLRGCDDLEEAKLGALGFQLWRQATPEEIEPVMGAKPGSLGTVKGTIKNPDALAGIFADQESENNFMGAFANSFQSCSCYIIRIAKIECIAYIESRHGCIAILVAITAAYPQQVHILQF